MTAEMKSPHTGTASQRSHPKSLRFSVERFAGLFLKEWLQIGRDRSPLLIGLLLPLFMLLIYGWGISMDMTSIPAAIVLEERTPQAQSLAADFAANRYFDAKRYASLDAAEAALASRDVELIIVVPSNFAAAAASGDVSLGITVYGVDANSALIFKNYAEGVARNWALKMRRLGKLEANPTLTSDVSNARPTVTVTSRNWFNEAAISTHYIVPGLLVLVTGVAGSLLGATAIAREWERGTMSALYAASASALEILLSKVLTLWLIVLAGNAICLVVAVNVFDVPVRGSLGFLFAGIALFAAWSIVLGLFVSAKTRSQFLASEAAVLLSFMPTLMLSGFLFDLRSVPIWIEALGRVLPPTHAIDVLRIAFLSGGSVERSVLSLAVIAGWTLVVFVAALQTVAHRGTTVKRLPREQPAKGQPVRSREKEAAA